MTNYPTHYDILCIPPQTKPIYLVIPAFSPEDPDGTRFYYEENTCPVNVFNRNCAEVIMGGDTDPHGIFEYVRTIPSPDFLSRPPAPGQGYNSNDEWPTILPEAFA